MPPARFPRTHGQADANETGQHGGSRSARTCASEREAESRGDPEHRRHAEREEERDTQVETHGRLEAVSRPRNATR